MKRLPGETLQGENEIYALVLPLFVLGPFIGTIGYIEYVSFLTRRRKKALSDILYERERQAITEL